MVTFWTYKITLVIFQRHVHNVPKLRAKFGCILGTLVTFRHIFVTFWTYLGFGHNLGTFWAHFTFWCPKCDHTNIVLEHHEAYIATHNDRQI